jgi:hypothetical protein
LTVKLTVETSMSATPREWREDGESAEESMVRFEHAQAAAFGKRAVGPEKSYRGSRNRSRSLPHLSLSSFS